MEEKPLPLKVDHEFKLQQTLKKSVKNKVEKALVEEEIRLKSTINPVKCLSFLEQAEIDLKIQNLVVTPVD